MDRLDSEDIRQRLMARRRTLLQRWLEENAEARELLDRRILEEEELATDQTMAGVLDRLGERELAQLERIADTIKRLDDESYGTCAVCADPIDRKRLLAIPETPYCNDCAEENERVQPDSWVRE